MQQMPATLTPQRLLSLWLPLAAAWMLLSLEGPVIQMRLARLAAPAQNLAALGVALALLWIFESPIFSILSAATALVKSKTSYRRLRNFTFGFSAGLTLLLGIMLLPPCYRFMARDVLALPDAVMRATWWASLCYLPGPFFVAYRRFYQGILIRSNRTSLVGVGSAVRLLTVAAALLVLAAFSDLPGAAIGTAASAIGIVTEAALARRMARASLQDLFTRPSADTDLSYQQIWHFYLPLALTGVIAMAVNPLMTFFLARAVQPVESLAVYPIVQSLGFVFSCTVLGLHELIISSLGETHEHYDVLRAFTGRLLAVTLLVLFVLLCTPLAALLFGTVYGLSADLVAFARGPARLVLVFPLIFTVSFWQRAVLIHAHQTAPVTRASAAELIVIGGTMAAFTATHRLSGLLCALLALICGRGAGALVLVMPYRAVRLKALCRATR